MSGATDIEDTARRIFTGRVTGTDTVIEIAVDATGRLLLSGTTAPSVLVFGRSAATVAGVALVLDVVTVLTDGVTVFADLGNTENIFVGGAGVTALTGIPLAAGVGIFVPSDDLAKIFIIDSGGGAQRARWLGG